MEFSGFVTRRGHGNVTEGGGEVKKPKFAWRHLQLISAKLFLDGKSSPLTPGLLNPICLLINIFFKFCIFKKLSL